jgi:adenosylcobinamide-phosphate synthase
MSRALTFALGALLDAKLADPPTRWHPVGLMGRAAHELHMLAPDDPHARRRYGLAVALGLPIASAAAAMTVRAVARRKHPMFGFAVDATLLSLMSSSRTLLVRASQVGAALAADDLETARELVGIHLVSRDTSRFHASEVAAATIESVAENLSDGVIAPWVAYALGGLPLAVAYRAANTLDAMWGYRTPEFEALGEGAARLDDLLNLMPARVAAVAIIAAARSSKSSPGTDAARALRTWRRDAGQTVSPNAGHPMSAMAGALGVRLGKEGVYLLGGEFAPPEARDIARAVTLARRALLLTGAAIMGVQLLKRGLR